LLWDGCDCAVWLVAMLLVKWQVGQTLD